MLQFWYMILNSFSDRAKPFDTFTFIYLDPESEYTHNEDLYGGLTVTLLTLKVLVMTIDALGHF